MDTSSPAPDEMLVDARGLNCPMPVIELAKAIRDLPTGHRVRLLATDSTARVDVPVWCRMQRERLLEAGEQVGEGGRAEFVFLVQRVSAGAPPAH